LLPALALFAHQAGGARRQLVAIGTPLAIFAAYPLLLLLSIDRPFAFLEAQEVVWERHLSPLGPLGGLLDAVAGLELLELAFAIPMLALAAVAWRRFGATYGVYAFGALLLPMAYPSERLGGLYSFPRLCLAAFPCLLALSAVTGRRRVQYATVAVLTTILGVFVVRWSLWLWVA
jgi:hypothetical protein